MILGVLPPSIVEAEKPLDLFNYLSVLTSIVLGLGVTGYFAHFAKLLGNRDHVKWSGLYGAWISLFFPLYVLYWWTFWDYRNQLEWKYFDFLFLIIGPGCLVLVTELFFPEIERPRQHLDLEKHYFSVQRPLFTMWSILQIWGIFCRPLLRDGLKWSSFLNGYKFSQCILLCFLAGGIFVKKRWFHFLIISVFWAVILYIIIAIRLKIGGSHLPQEH
ncbi:MAG: hypothetical protein JWO95_523 [Verrucomicrobiales bacterium]|nr:hypothetical protein [Verrucomicrobiales bacterium]